MTYPEVVDFEWNPANDLENQRKHGISFADAVRVFDSEELCLDIFDEVHSDTEERFITIGPVRDGLVLVEDDSHTITFEEGGALTVTLEGVIDGVADQTQVLTGTWVLVPNENYIENYGDYLVFDIDAQDGAALDEPIHWVDLMVIRHELLLLAPKVRAF